MGRARTPLHLPLQAAMDRQDIVKIRRTIPRAETVDGIIVDLSPRWLLVHDLWDGVRLNGFVALRVDDVRSVEVTGTQESLPWRALRHYGDLPTRPAGVDLTTTRTLIDTAARQFPLIVISLDVEDPTVAWIGTPDEITTRTLYLCEIKPDGSWDDFSGGFPLRDITAVGFGGAYETALHDVGDDPT